MSNEKPSFFKILSNMDFTQLLRISPAFITRYEPTLPEYVKLRVHLGRSWSVKVEKFRNGLFCFTEGWPVFARDAALQLGEILVFTQLTRSKFDVVIYEKSFCEREVQVLSPSPRRSQPPLNAVETNRQDLQNDVGSSREDDPLYFVICLTKQQHVSRIYLPVKFSVASGMYDGKEMIVEYLPSHDHKSVAVIQRVVINHRVKTPQARFELARGWREFRVTNGLAWGKSYSFEFNPNLNLIHVNKLRN